MLHWSCVYQRVVKQGSEELAAEGSLQNYGLGLSTQPHASFGYEFVLCCKQGVLLPEVGLRSREEEQRVEGLADQDRLSH